MTTVAVRSVPSRTSRSHAGLVVSLSVAAGLVLGLIGSALFALGAGFMFLARGSRRFTDQPQEWAFRPGVATAVVGVALFALAARSGESCKAFGRIATRFS